MVSYEVGWSTLGTFVSRNKRDENHPLRAVTGRMDVDVPEDKADAFLRCLLEHGQPDSIPSLKNCGVRNSKTGRTTS